MERLRRMMSERKYSEKISHEEIVNKIVEDLVTDKISSRECWERLCEFALIKDKKGFDDLILIATNRSNFASLC